MLYPSIDKLLNIVDSKYRLVNIVAQRSKSMIDNNHYQMKPEEYKSKKAIGKSLEELEKGLIKIVG